MGRPSKKGLDYFPLDTDLFSDLKVRKLLHYKGTDGLAVYCSALCMIYREGYMLKGTTELAFMIAELVKLKETRVQDIIESTLSIGLFDRAMFKEHGVLTSKGIQSRYAEICHQMKRNVCISEYNLLEENECQSGVSSEIKGVSSEETLINSGFSTQRKEKENKNKISSSVSSPLQVKNEEETDRESSLFLEDFFERHNRAMKYIGILSSRQNEAKDRLPILRFVTDKAYEDTVVEMIKTWPESEPLYVLRQKLEAAERAGTIKPMSYNDWTTIVWCKEKMLVSDVKRIAEKVRTGGEGAWECLVSAVRMCKNNPKIEKPGLYVLKCLSSNN